MEHLTQSSRGAASRDLAAELVETAAYDLAGSQASPRVARLTLTSAEVAQMAGVVQGVSDDAGRVC